MVLRCRRRKGLKNNIKTFRFFLPLIFLTGCSIVSANRVFPKLTWYWSWEAKVQRAERAKSKEWARTNLAEITFTDREAEDIKEAFKAVSTGYPLADKIAKRDGTNFLGVYLGMIALRYDGVIWPSTNISHSVYMYSATSGQLLRFISQEEFQAVYVLKTKPEYP